MIHLNPNITVVALNFWKMRFHALSAAIEDEDIINHTRKGLNLRQNKVEIRSYGDWDE